MSQAPSFAIDKAVIGVRSMLKHRLKRSRCDSQVKTVLLVFEWHRRIIGDVLAMALDYIVLRRSVDPADDMIASETFPRATWGTGSVRPHHRVFTSGLCSNGNCERALHTRHHLPESRILDS